MIVTFVTLKAFNGDLTKNPYNFKRSFSDTCELETLECKLGGNIIDGFSETSLRQDYLKLFTFLDLVESGLTNDLTFYMFTAGYYFMIFDFTAGLNAGLAYQAPLVREGLVNIGIKFTDATPEDLQCLLFCEYDSNFTIDHNRIVSTNFS